MSQSSPLTILLEQAKGAFFSEIENRREELISMEEVDALSETHEVMGTVIDACLDDQSDVYTRTLLLCCLESPDLFTKEPNALSCITENGSPGQVNAQHCVYHNLYDVLRSTLEHEFEEWYQEQQ